jgi:hypothetical protein
MKSIEIAGIATSVVLERYPLSLPVEQEVAIFESALGHRLPADYREFLLRYNGGVCELKNIIEPLDGYVCDLFGLHAQEVAGFMRLRLPSDWQAEWGELPSNLLPIGEVDSGDMIALRFMPTQSEVVIIDHESDRLRVELTEESFVQLLANTIREAD